MDKNNVYIKISEKEFDSYNEEYEKLLTHISNSYNTIFISINNEMDKVDDLINNTKWYHFNFRRKLKWYNTMLYWEKRHSKIMYNNIINGEINNLDIDNYCFILSEQVKDDMFKNVIYFKTSFVDELDVLKLMYQDIEKELKDNIVNYVEELRKKYWLYNVFGWKFEIVAA